MARAADRNRLGIPHLDRAIITYRDDSAPVRAEYHARDGTFVASERQELMACNGIPEPNRPIFTRRCDPAAVGAKGYARDLAAVAAENAPGVLAPSRSGVPETGRPVGSGRYQPFSVRGEGDTADKSLVAIERVEQPPIRRGPDANDPIAASDRLLSESPAVVERPSTRRISWRTLSSPNPPMNCHFRPRNRRRAETAG